MPVKNSLGAGGSNRCASERSSAVFRVIVPVLYGG